jgi:hypothetical protein
MADKSGSASTQMLIHCNILPSVAQLQRLHSAGASEGGQNRGEKRQGAWQRFLFATKSHLNNAAKCRWFRQ